MQVDITNIIGITGVSMDIKVLEPLSENNRSFEGITFNEPILIQARLTNKGEGRLCLSGKAKVTFTGNCSRCNTVVRQNLNLELDAEYRGSNQRSRRPDYEDNLDKDEIYAYTGVKIDLEQLLLDELLPNLPMKILCTEDCRGLCSYCGQNLNHEQCDCRQKDVIENSPFGKLKNLLD